MMSMTSPKDSPYDDAQDPARSQTGLPMTPGSVTRGPAPGEQMEAVTNLTMLNACRGVHGVLEDQIVWLKTFPTYTVRASLFPENYDSAIHFLRKAQKKLRSEMAYWEQIDLNERNDALGAVGVDVE